MRCLGDERISDSRRGYFALGCCYRAYGGLMSCLGDERSQKCGLFLWLTASLTVNGLPQRA
nr:MAG TPA: hypothetical protein [Caudoviricetes sp.]